MSEVRTLPSRHEAYQHVGLTDGSTLRAVETQHRHLPLIARMEPALAGPVVSVVPSAFTPVLAKHSKNFSIEDSFAIGVDRIQGNFEPLKRQIEAWRGGD